MKAVIDTNVLRVAAEQHDNVSPACITECVKRLQRVQSYGVTVIDDNYRILKEYMKNPSVRDTNTVGGQFLKWLLQQLGNPARVQQVPLTERDTDFFVEFPDPALELQFDPADRKFAAVANAHPDRPSIWQAADGKWLNWWPVLHAKGLTVDFLCPDDVCRFYQSTYPDRAVPALPGAQP